MDEFGSLWGYQGQESMDELKQKLFNATLELESARLEANQENFKNKENVRNLLNLLQMAYKERDEAKNQLQKLLCKLTLCQFQAESPVFIPTAGKTNSSITESNSLSDTYNNPHSHGSPADSFFDAVSSPDFSTLNKADSATISAAGFCNHPFVVLPECNPKVEVDPTALMIEDIAKGKKLPEKGRLLEAVMEAGPLLQTLLVAGPLPQWRNPPPLQAFKIPPVLMKGGGGVDPHMAKSEQKPMSRMCSSSMLNFSGAAAASSDSCFNNGVMMLSSSAPSSSFASQMIPSAKRHRFY